MAELAARAADEKSASNIAVIDVSDVLAITELFVIASADNERQVRSVVEEGEDALTPEGFEPKRRQGVRDNRWVLLHDGVTVVHVQRAQDREYYGLDRLHPECPLIESEGIEPATRPGTWDNSRDAQSIDNIPPAEKEPEAGEEY